MGLIESTTHVQLLMEALAGALEAEEAERVEIVVCGGCALNATGLVTRVTHDVDVLARIVDDEDVCAEPFPEGLGRAIARVARDRELPPNWMNTGPSDLQRFGLPNGLRERALRVEYSDLLSVRYIARLDQIHLKLYALVDQGTGKHVQDFQALSPNSEEARAAAVWSMSHDPSEGFRDVLIDALDKLGYSDVARSLR